MQNNTTLKNIADDLMKKEGNVKGEVFHTHTSYIRYREGEEGLRKVEKELESLGYPVKLDKTHCDHWYKDGLSTLVILAAKEIFNWKEEDVFDMGNSAPKNSFIVKMLVKHFLSIEDVFEKAEQYWSKHYDFASLEKGEFNEKNKYASIMIKNYDSHPLICEAYLRGYILRIAQFSLKSENIEVEKTECNNGGSDCHKYIIRWS